MDLIWIKCLIILLLNCTDTEEYSYDDVEALHTKLFATKPYNKKIRPLFDQDVVQNITIDFFITAITHFDEQDGSLTTAGFLVIYWRDELLTWKTEDNNGISSITIPQDDIWKPDVSLFNSYSSFKGLGSPSLNAWIAYNGYVSWVPFQVFKSTCSVDIKYFPFDTQYCNLEFIAWSYTKAQIKFKTYRGIDMSEYTESSTWEIADSFTIFENTFIPTLRFTLILNRKPLFYLFNMILPVILLSLMNIFTFKLPVKSGERASFSVTLFLSISVFLTIIASEFPKNSDNPSYLALYLTIMTIISTIFVIITVLQLRLLNREDRNIPVGQGYIFLHKITSILRCKTCKKQSSKVSNIQNGKNEIVAESNQQNGPVTWSDVIEVIDFLCFWIGSIVISTVTFAILLTLLNNPYRQ